MEDYPVVRKSVGEAVEHAPLRTWCVGVRLPRDHLGHVHLGTPGNILPYPAAPQDTCGAAVRQPTRHV
jgi:hypothetical protein